jgi:hypothetical protein
MPTRQSQKRQISLPRASVWRFFFIPFRIFIDQGLYISSTLSFALPALLFCFLYRRYLFLLYSQVLDFLCFLVYRLGKMSKSGDFDAARKDIIKLLHQPEYDDGSAGPVLVRLAW